MNIYITYSNERYRKVRDFSAHMAICLGKFDRIITYSPEDIDDGFRRYNSLILSKEKGNGLWLWKPYFIKKALEEADNGDIVFYADAASFFIRSCHYIVDDMPDDIWLCDLPYIEEEYTKRETFIDLDCDTDEYKKSHQVQASFMAFRKNDKTIDFVERWLECCIRSSNISDEFNEKIQIPTFVGHKMDQSVLSILAKKDKIATHYDVSQFGKWHYKKDSCNTYKKLSHPKNYPICIILHRKDRISILYCIGLYLGITFYPRFLRKIYKMLHCK